jgi:predicted nucleic acid-binding protein
VIFIDSNIPMYVVGSDDRLRVEAQLALEREVAQRARLVTSAEVFQEILHRYLAIKRPDAIQPVFDLLAGVVDETFPIDYEDVVRAREVVGVYNGVSARNALHVAVMRRHSVNRILSHDHGFDQLPDIERLQ